MSGRVRFKSQEHRELARRAEESGWTWSHTSSGHLRWEHPSVPSPVFTPGTPRTSGSHKQWQKLRTALARAGQATHA